MIPLINHDSSEVAVRYMHHYTYIIYQPESCGHLGMLHPKIVVIYGEVVKRVLKTYSCAHMQYIYMYINLYVFIGDHPIKRVRVPRRHLQDVKNAKDPHVLWYFSAVCGVAVNKPGSRSHTFLLFTHGDFPARLDEQRDYGACLDDLCGLYPSGNSSCRSRGLIQQDGSFRATALC